MDAFVATELRGHSAQGQTVPLYLACRVRGEAVVYQSKLGGRRSGLSPRELGVEMLGTTIAHEVGLHVARPALITLPPNLIEQIEDRYQFGVQDATAFGAVWKPRLTPFLPEVETSMVSAADCEMLLALDLLLTNGDRTGENPNVSWDGNRLLIFDFEHSLELPRLEFDRRLSLHLDSLSPLYSCHLMAPRVDAAAAHRASERLLASLNIESLRRDAYGFSTTWHQAWVENVEYLGYIQSAPGAFLDRVMRLSR